MDLSEIPKSFWHSISFSIFIVTCTFVGISIANGQIAIKWDDLELSAGNVREKTSELQSEIQSLLEEKLAMTEQLGTFQLKLEDLESSLGSCENDSSEISNKFITIKEAIRLQKERNNVQIQELQKKEAEIQSIHNKLDKIGSSDNNIEKQQTVIIENAWAKPGYFLSIENDIRLNVNSVSKDKVQVNIARNGADIKPLSLAPSESASFEYEDTSYTVTLNSVGSAGFNPLKPAAYFKVSKK